MSIILVYTIDNKSDPKTLGTILEEGYQVELEFKNRADFQFNYSRYGELLSKYNKEIICLRGPSTNMNGSTLFEDTVFIASTLEDLFNIDFVSITTFSLESSSHIEELADFYNGIKTIHVTPDYKFVVKKESPIDFVFKIRRWNELGLFNVGMIYNDIDLDKPWKSRSILYALNEYITQVDAKIPVYFNSSANYDFKWLKDLFFLKKDLRVHVSFNELEYTTCMPIIQNIVRNLSSYTDDSLEALE